MRSSVRFVTRWGVTAGCVLVVLGTAACAGGDGAAATPSTRQRDREATTKTAPERMASTTTTAYDPATIEGQVEAAYLKSWDVYAAAVYDLVLDESALAEVYAEEHLDTKRSEIQRRIGDGRAAWVRLEHDYSIQLTGPSTAVVVDRYRNHQVLIDPVTKEPVEADPDAEVVDVTTLKLFGAIWKVTRIEGLQ